MKLTAWIDRSRAWSAGRQIGFALVVITAVAWSVGAITGAANDHTARPAVAGPPELAPAVDLPTSSPSTMPPASPASTGSPPSTDPPPATDPRVPVMSDPPAETTTSAPPAVPTTTTAPPADGTLAILAEITVQLEHRGGYDRDLFAVWSDLDGDGCDTRDEVLIRDSLTLAQVDPSGCQVVAGDWYSIYDGLTFTSPADLQVDHVVSLKEAWDSGAWAWDVDTRIAFANDLTDPRTLRAVSGPSNQSKGDKDPSNWLPAEPAICQYVVDWIAIKHRWGLSMDQSEHGRLGNLLEGPCAGS